jgi:hypothetical protein
VRKRRVKRNGTRQEEDNKGRYEEAGSEGLITAERV